MPMPEKNYFFDQLPKNCDVELRQTERGGNSYYVAIIDGVEGVVSWEGQKARESQLALKQMAKDTTMRRQGYVCEISHHKIGEPLYFKSVNDVGPFLRTQHPKIKNVKTRMIV